MFASAPALTVAALSLQSGGSVLFSAFLAELHAAQYVFCSLLLTAAVCLVLSRGRLPARGWVSLLLLNVLTAMSFVGFYVALRYLPPAMVGAFDIGIAVLASIAMETLSRRKRPSASRLVCGMGIGAACAMLGWIATQHVHGSGVALPALAACLACGIGSAGGVHASQRLLRLGWNPYALLAHRFHLSLGLALLWAHVDAPSIAAAGSATGLILLGVGVACVLLPQLLLQWAISRAGAGSVLISMGLQPALAYGFSMLTPNYAWHAPTFVAVALVTVSVVADIRLRGIEPPVSETPCEATFDAPEPAPA